VLFVAKHPAARAHLRLNRAGATCRRRLLRSTLLRLSTIQPKFPDWFIVFSQWLEQRRPRGLDAYYDFALDYFYWLGAKAERRERLRIT
jgi:hypothetical protein